LADYVICARNIKGKKFGEEPAKSSYLLVPEDKPPAPSQAQSSPDRWAKQVMDDARKGVLKTEYGNILVFVHGYNNDQDVVMRRHRELRKNLEEAKVHCTIVSFDWPSHDVGAFYLADLANARKTAHQLLEDGIMLLARFQIADCRINVHVLAHSMGAYVTREAFTMADDVDELTGKTWYLSQVMLIAGDISAASLRASDQRTNGLYRNCTRLTCYSNRHDDVLGLSNVKRAGVRPRAGRVGLPDDAPATAVNVDCSDYWMTIPANQPIIGNRQHSWHIGDPVFTRDMIDTMTGTDRQVMPTRELITANRFKLVRPA
jgi:esterase/lipase superfamily enzyme